MWHFCTYRTCRHALDMIRRMQTKAYIYGMRWSAVMRNETWLKYGRIHKILNKTLTFFRFIISANERRSQEGPQTLNCGPEAEFLDEIPTKVLKVFLLANAQSSLQLFLEISISSNSRNLLQLLQFSYCTLVPLTSACSTCQREKV